MTVCCFAALVVGGARWGIVPTTAALIASLLGVIVSSSIAYLTSFRGPDIKLRLFPEHVFDHQLVSGYAAGMPSTWSIVVSLIAINDSPRPGVLGRFGIDEDAVEYVPKRAKTFEVRFSGLEWKKPPSPSMHASFFPVPLPLLLTGQAREKVSFRAMLQFVINDPGALADDLRAVSGLRVKYRYQAGSEEKPREKTGSVSACRSLLSLRSVLMPNWIAPELDGIAECSNPSSVASSLPSSSDPSAGLSRPRGRSESGDSARSAHWCQSSGKGAGPCRR